MNYKTKRNLLSVLLSILCAVVLFCSVGLLSTHGNKSAVALAPTASDTVIQLTLDSTNLAPEADANGKMFSGEGLAKLYDAILGTDYNNVGTYNKLKKAFTNDDGTTIMQTWTSATPASNTVAVPKGITAEDIRNNHGKNIQIMIGKTAFEVVYVTLDNNGDVIVDLWQSDSTQTSPYSANSAGNPGYAKDNGRVNEATSRPSNVYGNSYIRAKMLGQGGSWDEFVGDKVNSNPATATAGQSTSSDYAALWNSMTTGALSAFIDTPSQVKYQEVETYSMYAKRTSNGTGSNIKGWWQYTLPGEAYGTPFDEYYHDGSSHYYTSGINTGYGGNGTNKISGQDQWKNDKLWLPSLTETGHMGVDNNYSEDPVKGIWDLDVSQRNNNGASYSSVAWNGSTAACTWLRTGDACDSNYAQFLTFNAVMFDKQTATGFAVRPALHLNLKNVSQSAVSSTGSDAADFTAVNTPQDLTFTYTGETFTSLEKIVKWVEGGDDNLDPATKTDARLKDTIKGDTSWFDTVHHKLYYTSDSDMSVLDSNNFLHSKASGSIPCAAVMYKIEYAQGSSDANGNSTSNKATTTLEKFEIKGAGVYTITCKFEPNAKYKWRDPKTGALDTDTTKEFKIIVKQKKVAYEWKSLNGELNEANTDVDKRWKTTFALDFIPAEGALANTSKAPWVYVSYTLIDNVSKGILDNTNAKQNQTYAWDSSNSKHVVQVSGADDDTLPCIVLKFTNPTEKYDNDIEHIYACNEPIKKGEKYPQQAGNYLAEAENVNAKTSNYELVSKDTTTTLKRTYEIEKMEIETPALRDPVEYTGDWVEFEIAAYNTKVGTGTNAKWYYEFVQYGNKDDNGEFEEFLMPTDDDGTDLGLKHELTGTGSYKNKLVFKAHDADEYTIYYRLQTTTVDNTALYPNPVVRNYKWKCTTPENVTDTEGKNVDGKSIDLKRIYEIAPKTLEFNFNSLKKDDDGNFVPANTWDIKTNDETSKLTYTFAAGKGPVDIRTLSADESTWDVDPNGNKEEPVLELWYYETKKGDTAAKKPTLKDGDDPAEFIFFYIMNSNNKHATGEYTIMVKIAAVDEGKPETLVNKNYRVKVTPERNDGESDEDYKTRVNDALKTYRQAMKLKAAEASLDDIAMKYQSEKMKEDGTLPADLPYADPEVEGSKNLAYGWNADKEAPLQYFFTANFDDIDFLEIDTSYGDGGYIFIYLDKDGNEAATLGDGEGFAKASKVRVKFKVKVKSDERENNKMPKGSEYKGVNDGGKFTYTPGDADTNGNIFDGILSFDYEIVKATVSTDDLNKLPLQYQFTGDTKWTTYDPDNPPEYNAGKSITFRPDPDKLPQGVKEAEVVSSLGDFKNPGTPTISIKVTVDDNYDEVKNFNLKPTISAQVIDISADMWKVENLKDKDGEAVKDGQGAPYQITTLNPEKLADSTYADYIDYEYWTMVDDGNGGFKPGVLIGKNQNAIDKLIDPEGDYKASSTNSYPVFIRPVLNNKVPTVNGTPKFVLKDKSGNSVEDDDGNSGFMAYNFGESKDLIVVKMLKTSSIYGDSVNYAEIFSITYEDGTAFQAEHYVIKIADSKKNDLGALSGFDFSKADAGVYTLTIEFTDPEMAKDFVFTESGGKFTIEKKAIAVPTLDDFEYNGSIIDITAKLGGTYLDETLKKYMAVSGDTEGKDVKESGYVIFIKLTNGNYKWADGSENAAVKFTLTGATAEVTSDDTAKLVWNITPFVLKDLKWNTSKTNAQLNIPENVKAILSAAGVEIAYNYYDQNGELVTKLEGGKTYRAEAVLTGDGAALGNVVFEKISEDGSTVPSLVSDKKVYETKKSFFASALDWAKKNWWILLAILVGIILLILLICLLVHRRKTKEAREEKKAQKEEEQRRREEEREAERRRREQELELQKAKQEAELAKMKAELGLGAGAAGMAMAAQQQPQQQQQPPQQQMPQQMPQYQPPQYPQYPQPQYMPMPQQMPMPQPQQSMDSNMMMLMQAQLTEIKAEQRADKDINAMKTELEVMRLKLEGQHNSAPVQQLPYSAPAPQQFMPADNNMREPNMDKFGAFVASVWRNMNKPAPDELMQYNTAKSEPETIAVEESASAPVASAYPPDAVITTTTTVDTTKRQKERGLTRDESSYFDIDGFYDEVDTNKQ